MRPLGLTLIAEHGAWIRDGPDTEWRATLPIEETWKDRVRPVIERFLDLMEALAERGPVILALEDLHWADLSTLRALRSFVRRLSHLPVTLLATLRSFRQRERWSVLAPNDRAFRTIDVN